MKLMTKEVMELISNRPGLRTVEIADKLDCDFDVVEASLEGAIDSGRVVKYDVVAPNGRHAKAYRIAGVMAPRVDNIVETAKPEIVPEQPAPAVSVDTEPLTKTDKVILFLKSQPGQVATTEQIRQLLDMKKGHYPQSYLTTALATGRIVKDGPAWRLGEEGNAASAPARVPSPMPRRDEPAPVVAIPAFVPAVQPAKAAAAVRDLGKTPLIINILLHYHTAGGDYRDGDLSAPAVAEAMQWLVDAGLLRLEGTFGRRYVPTDALPVYVEALCAVPFPVQKWVMP